MIRTADEGRISHAQLFTGDAGSGALPLAMAYAQYVNCRHRRNGEACGVCPDCVQAEALAHPDIHFVFPVNKQGKKSGEIVLSKDFMPLWRETVGRTGGYFSAEEWFRALDLGKTLQGLISAREADEIIRLLSFKSFEAEYKTVIIWLPETMNGEAANKLLKILEEPWRKTLFLLVSEHPERLLATVISRTQEVAVPRIAVEDLTAAAQRMGVTDAAKAHNMARLSNGSLLELRRQAAGDDEESRREFFESFRSLMRLCYNDRHLDLLAWADDMAQWSRERQRSFLIYAVRFLRESYMRTAGLGSISYLWGEEAEFCSKFAPFVHNGNIEPAVAQCEQALAQLGQNGNPKIVLSHFALAVSKMIGRR